MHHFSKIQKNCDLWGWVGMEQSGEGVVEKSGWCTLGGEKTSLHAVLVKCFSVSVAGGREAGP